MTNLAALSSAQFASIEGRTVTLRFQDGLSLGATVDSVSEQPRATPRDAPRTAFIVLLAAPEPCASAGGVAELEHPELGTIGPLLIERTVPPTLSTASAYFKVSFN